MGRISCTDLKLLLENIIRHKDSQSLEMKENIVTVLEMKNTVVAYNALSNLLENYPEDEMLKQAYIISEQQYLNKKMKVNVSPSDMKEIVLNKHSRFIRSESQLLDVVIESLSRFQEFLFGKTPGIVYLWDEWDANIKPKDEEAFSDFIKLFLERDLVNRGVIINREVEIRRHKFNNKDGERTDILVETYVRKGKMQEEFISLIIEVKGCWNKDLKKDLENKLANRYLKEYPSKSGLYLVGWFSCEKWFESDYDNSRKSKTPKISIEDARNLFTKQAEQNSNDEKTIKSVVLDTGLH